MTNAQIQSVTGLSDVIRATKARGIILDIFGVVHDGEKPFPHAIESLQQLQSTGIKTCLLSNTPRHVEHTKESLLQKNITTDLYDHIITSGEVASANMDRYIGDFGKKCWFFSCDDNQGKETECVYRHQDKLSFVDGPKEADFFIISNPGILVEETDKRNALYRQLDIALKHKLTMICTNPDMVADVGSNRELCSGTFAKYYEEKGGTVEYIGKPHKPVYDHCMQFFNDHGISSKEIIAVGDTPHTDIQGAKSNGMYAVFNAAGIHAEDVMDNHQMNMAAITNLFSQKSHIPDFAMPELRW